MMLLRLVFEDTIWCSSITENFVDSRSVECRHCQVIRTLSSKHWTKDEMAMAMRMRGIKSSGDARRYFRKLKFYLHYMKRCEPRPWLRWALLPWRDSKGQIQTYSVVEISCLQTPSPIVISECYKMSWTSKWLHRHWSTLIVMHKFN